MIKVTNLKFSYNKREIIKGISFCVKNTLAILGENGCGKSTLLKCMLNLVNFSGEILLDNKDITQISRKNLAKKIAYIPQFQNSPFDYTVVDMVLMGLLTHKNLFENYSKKDIEICSNTLEMLKISHLRSRIFTHLSGGEKQLVYIARALVSGAKIIFMDEPVSGLDFGNQIRLFNLIKKLQKDGYNIIITSHNPRHIKFLECNVLMIKNGVKFKEGRVDILNSNNISQLYEVNYDKYKELL